jgi:hypothetical protein
LRSLFARNPCSQLGGDGKILSHVAAYVPGVQLFDAELFGVGRNEAVMIDPQCRRLLHASAAAMEQTSRQVCAALIYAVWSAQTKGLRAASLLLLVC